MKVFSGKGVGKIVEDTIKSSKRFLVAVSPWISEKYAKALFKKSREGVNVIVVTTKDSEKTFLKLIKKYCSKKPSKKLLLLGLLLLPFVIGLFILLIAILKSKSAKTKGGKIKIIIVDENFFVHVKAYINEKYAIIGSANLTESGLWKNVEILSVFDKATDRDEYESVREEVQKVVSESESNAKKVLRC